MSDFNFFLNRQGIQGRKGDKGDAGFTPTISVSEQTLNSYKLKIANEYNEFETPNLIGNLGVTDNGGTYLRYDPTSGTVSTGEIDGATTEVVGGVRKSTDADLTNLSADTVVTPANVADMLPLLLEAGTDNVTITQDEATSKTKISVAGGGSGSGDIPIATTTTAGKVKPDGTTITITDDGTISAIGGGGSTDSYTKSETDALLSEKNDNIFDIGKFTVVGSPTITDDGVASGFSVSDYVTKRLTFTPNSSLKYTVKFTTSSNIDTNQYTIRFYNNLTGQYATNACGIYQGNIRIIFKDGVIQTYPCSANTTYYVEMNFTIAKSEAKIYSEKKELLKTLTYTAPQTLMKGNNSLLTIGVLTNNGITISNPFTGSIDLKQLSITVDGQEVFSGLMNSTKPIYDAIEANNTELSEFKTETSTDFSAVISALNEKANLSDVALKQNILVSGTNIKTINGQSILGEGNITVGGGGGSTPTNMVTTDTAQDSTANKTFYGEIRVGADNNYATLAKFSKEAIQSGDSTLL